MRCACRTTVSSDLTAERGVCEHVSVHVCVVACSMCVGHTGVIGVNLSLVQPPVRRLGPEPLAAFPPLALPGHRSVHLDAHPVR